METRSGRHRPPHHESRTATAPSMTKIRIVLFSSPLILKEGETMYHNLFRNTLLVIAIATILVACGTSTPNPALATKAPIATKAVPTATEIAPTNTPEPTATQVVLGVVTGRIV